MPLVVVTRNPQVISDESLPGLAAVLRNAVAVCLAVEEDGGSLTDDEIEVRFREPGPHDVNSLDLQIEIQANWFASRAANIDERVVYICEHVEDRWGEAPHDVDLFTGKRAFVWVCLMPAGFRMF